MLRCGPSREDENLYERIRRVDWLGTTQALLAALLFGLTAPLAKRYLTIIPAIEATGLLYLSAGLVLGAWLAAQRLIAGGASSKEAALRRADWPYLAGAIVFGGLIGPTLLLFGLSRATGTVASLLLNLEAVFTVLLAISFGEALGRRAAGGVIAIIAASAVLAFDPGQLGATTLLGVLALVGACASWGLDNNLTQRLSGRNPLAIVTVKGLCAGPMALALAFAIGAPWPTPTTFLAALLLGASGYGLSLAFFVLALRHVGSARAGSLFATAPFVGALASIPVLGERPTPYLLASGVIMAVGVHWLITENHSHEHAHEDLAHDHAHMHDEHHQHEHEGDFGPEPHAHPHVHVPLSHSHPHTPDLHHRHRHE
jgi:drug/metabolite transporter (DMT)-like permease